METVSFESVRGKFRFNSNHFPIQNFYLADVERDAAGGMRNAYRDLIVADHPDSYVDACKMPG
jgi:branched-chain amino acid transport system substrate-binding protein